MGSSPTEFPEHTGGSRSAERDPLWRYILLFLLTVYTTTSAGAGHYLSFYLGFGGGFNPFTASELLIGGLWYSVPILAILGCTNLGTTSPAATTAWPRLAPIFCRCPSS